MLFNVRHYKLSETLSASLAKMAEYLMPSYFCRSSNEDLDILSWSVIYQERAPHSTSTQLALHHCYFTVIASAGMQTVIPVGSSGHLQSLRPLDMIHGTSLRGRQEDEEISSGGIQSLLTLLPATPSLHRGLHIWATFKFSSTATAKLVCVKNCSEIHHQIYKDIPDSRDSIFTVRW